MLFPNHISEFELKHRWTAVRSTHCGAPSKGNQYTTLGLAHSKVDEAVSAAVRTKSFVFTELAWPSAKEKFPLKSWRAGANRPVTEGKFPSLFSDMTIVSVGRVTCERVKKLLFTPTIVSLGSMALLNPIMKNAVVRVGVAAGLVTVAGHEKIDFVSRTGGNPLL